MTYFVYILYSEKDKGLYTGCSNNLEQRIKAHQSGKVISTKNRRPVTLIYKESYNSKKDAFVRERYLKTKYGNTFKKRVKNFYINKISHKRNQNLQDK